MRIYGHCDKSPNIIKVSDPFFNEILEIWSEDNYEENIMSDYHLRSSPLWYNSLRRVENRPVLYKDWFLKGITKVEHLMDDSGKFLSLATFRTIHDLTVRPLTSKNKQNSIKEKVENIIMVINYLTVWQQKKFKF